MTNNLLNNQNLTILSPLTNLAIRQSLISKLQNDLSIQIQFVNSLNELFLTIPTSETDYVGIDIEELCKNNIQSFEILSTLHTLIACSLSNIKNIKIIGLADNTTDYKIIKDIMHELNGHVVCRLSGDFIYDDVYNDLYNLINCDNYTISPKIANLIKPKKRIVKNNNVINLTPRQRQILQIITLKGASNKTIAKLLNISESTVKLHISAIFKKYGVKNRTQLAVFSNKSNIIN